MPRIKKKIEIQAEIAAQEAKEEVYQEAKIKKKKEKKPKEYESASKTTIIIPQTKWIGDEKQEEVFFDGYAYWLIMVSPKSKKNKIRKVSFVRLTPEQWEERIKKEEKNNE